MGECNMFKRGSCRFGYRCKFSHNIEKPDVLFSRLTMGDSGKVDRELEVKKAKLTEADGAELLQLYHEILNSKNIKVLLDSDKQQELKQLLSTSSYHTTISADNDHSSGRSSPSSSEDEGSNSEGGRTSQLHAQQELEKKYSHIPDSIFKQMFMQNILANSKSNQSASGIVKSAINRDSKLDFDLREEYIRITENSIKYKEILEFRRKLPAYDKKSDILDLIEENPVVVISGETGCGKTTQVAQFILDDYIEKNKGSLCHIVCTQPRRISAISVAERVAAERDEACGSGCVGYQIRLDKMLPRKQGSIIYCTTGILLQWMQSDPGLSTVSHVIIDEIHERNINSDFVMTVLRQLLPQRPDLKVILMSATLNSVQFSRYFNDCPTLEIEGKIHPVEVFYLEDAMQLTSYVREGFGNKTRRRPGGDGRLQQFWEFITVYVRTLKESRKYSELVLEQLLQPESEHIDLQLIMELVEYICRTKEDGAILIFLPGWEQISTLFKKINGSEFFCLAVQKDEVGRNEAGRAAAAEAEEEVPAAEEPNSNVISGYDGMKYLVLPLHSKMPTVNQSQVFDRPPEGVRKIIISTNIAETSITIDDVVFIIDSGKMKMRNYDVENNISTLQDEWVSIANAKQRRGRAGRVQPGECYHLFTKGRERTLDKYPKPEMLRTRLEDLILQIKMLQLGMVIPFLGLVMDSPNPKTVEVSLKLLQTLKALDEDENLTPLGFHLAKLPLDPQIGKMILMGAIFSCVDPIFSIAACLSEKDPFFLPLGKDKEANKIKLDLSNGTKSDHLIYAEGFKQWEEATCKRKGGHFCKKHFMSGNTLRTLRQLKTEFAEQLHEMGFLSNKHSKDPEANRNSHNTSLVKAIICAGLYPNVAIVERVELIRSKGTVKITLRTPEDGEVKLHRISINENARSFESPYLMYHKKLKSSYIFIHDTTMISSLPLLVFGHNIKPRGTREIVINDIISFRCDPQLAQLVQRLRIETQQVLDKKILAPGTIDWTSNSQETKILRALIELVTDEDEKMLPKPEPKPEPENKEKKVVEEYEQHGLEFLLKVFNCPDYLKEVSGLAQLCKDSEDVEVLDWSDSDPDNME